jgi:hypothetical protein
MHIWIIKEKWKKKKASLGKNLSDTSSQPIAGQKNK